MISYRQGRLEDRPKLLDLIEKGFSVQRPGMIEPWEGEAHRRLFSHLYAKPFWDPEWLTLAEENGAILAAAGLFPQTLNMEGVPLPCWAVSPVVTDPERRGQGLGGACLAQTAEYARKQNVPALYLWGLPEYYPHYGFVPILPRYKTILRPERNRLSKVDLSPGQPRRLQESDLEQIALLYNQSAPRFWLQPDRTFSWWQERYQEMGMKEATIIEAPFPVKENFRVWENDRGKIAGYWYLTEDTARNRVEVQEAVCEDGEIARAILALLAGEYFKKGYSLVIRGTPEHDLNREAYQAGGIHFDPAPAMGMIQVIDWIKLLQRLRPVFHKRLADMGIQNGVPSKSFRLREGQEIIFSGIGTDGNIEVEAAGLETMNPQGKAFLTRKIFGCDDLNDHSISASDTIQDMILFPKKHPFIWDANYLY